MALKFLHPHLETVINDNSFVSEDTSGVGTVLFQPFISDKGEDNTIIRYGSLSQFIKQNGEPNFRKHGQSIYNIVNWLKAGGVVYGSRLMPENATFANLALVIKTKEEEIVDIINHTTRTVLKVATEIVGLENITDKKTFGSVLKDTQIFPEIDDEGYRLYPLYTLSAKGRGSYGDQYGIRLNYNNSLASTYEFKSYNLSILQKDDRGILREIEGPYVVSTNPDAVSMSGSSMFIKNIIESYSDNIECTFNEDSYDELLDELVKYLPEGTLPDTIDFLFCRDADLTQYKDIMLDVDATNKQIERYEGVSFSQGGDGDFELKSKNRAIAIEKELNAIFTGVKIPQIANKKALPFDVILDANYPNTVKANMDTFASTIRQDIIAILDTGLQPSVKSTLDWRKNDLSMSSYYSAIYGQHFMVEDGYTNSDISVTTTYFLASLIPDMDNRFGIQFPLAGPNRGVLKGFKKNSLSYNPDELEQEDLYINRVNYIVQDYDTTQLSSNLTTQVRTSALSSINNVRVLLKIIRQIETKAKYYMFEFADAATLSNFSQDLKFIESEWTSNRACSTLSIKPYQTAYDIEQKTARVKVDVVFNGTVERVVIEVNVGK